MGHAPIELYKHIKALSALNSLMIKIKLHLSGIKPLTENEITDLDELADIVRKDLERCREPGLKY